MMGVLLSGRMINNWLLGNEKEGRGMHLFSELGISTSEFEEEVFD